MVKSKSTSSGDELTGNKAGIMGGGTTVDGKGDINKQVGIMGSGDNEAANTTPVSGTKKYIDGVLLLSVRFRRVLKL